MTSSDSKAATSSARTWAASRARRIALLSLSVFAFELLATPVVGLLTRGQAAWIGALADAVAVGALAGAAWQWLQPRRRTALARPAVLAERVAPWVMAAAAMAIEFVAHSFASSMAGNAGRPWAPLVDACLVGTVGALVALWLDWMGQLEATTLSDRLQAEWRPQRVVWIGLAGACGLITLVSSLGVVGLLDAMGRLAPYTEIANLVSGQRMLGERIARLASLVEHDEPALRSSRLEELVDALDRAKREGNQLERTAALLGGRPVAQMTGAPVLVADTAARLADLLERGQALVASHRNSAPSGGTDGRATSVQGAADLMAPVLEQTERAWLAAAQSERAALRAQAVVGAALLLVVLLSSLAVAAPVARIVGNQHRALAERARELGRLTLVARNTHNPVFICGADRRIVWVNHAFETFSGYRADEVAGALPLALMRCPDTDLDAVESLRTALAEKQGARAQLLAQTRHGTRRWVDIDIRSVSGEGGEFDGYIAVLTDVSERVRSQRKVEALFRGAAAGIVVQNSRGEIVECNAEAEALLGLTRDQMTGRTSTDPRWRAIREDGSEFHGDDHPAMQTLRSGKPVRGVMMGIETPQGECRWLYVNSQLIPATADEEPAVITSFTDVSERRRNEATLAAQHVRLEAIIAGTRAGTWEWNVQSGATVFNDRWAEIVGYTLEELAPLSIATWERLVHPDDLAHSARQLERHFDGELEFYDVEVRMRHKDGHWVWVRDRGRVATRNERGEPLTMYGTHVDISKRRRAADELERTHAKLRSLFELSPVGIALNDMASGEFIECNDALALATGYRREEMTSLSYWDLTPRDYEAQEAEQRRRLETTGSYGPYEKEYIRRDGSRFPVLLSGVRVRQPDGRDFIWSIVQDISARKLMETQLQMAARVDRLTGLANRALLMERLEHAIERSLADRSRGFVLLFLDFDRFKLVNDSLGHDAGDELLRQIAVRMRSALRASDVMNPAPDGNLVARFGGDEFVVLLNTVRRVEDGQRVAQRLLEALAPAYDLHGHEIHSSASIGIVSSDQCMESADVIVRNADTAMYEAKRAGRGRAVVFDEGMHKRLARNLQLEGGLRRALESSQLQLAYQPIIDLDSGRASSVEALLRWNHPEFGSVSPDEFIPIAEECGLILPIGEWVLREACVQYLAWHRQAPAHAPALMSVNLSRVQMSHPERLLESVREVLDATGMPAQCLQLEVTEREVMHSPEAAKALMRSLRELGVKLAMDDFGTGTSSLACLREYQFDVIKIDRAFVADLEASPDMLAVIHATVTLVENLGMASVAEGVETAAQVAILQSIGCRYAQGYHFCRPVPGDRLPASLGFADVRPQA